VGGPEGTPEGAAGAAAGSSCSFSRNSVWKWAMARMLLSMYGEHPSPGVSLEGSPMGAPPLIAARAESPKSSSWICRMRDSILSPIACGQ